MSERSGIASLFTDEELQRIDELANRRFVSAAPAFTRAHPDVRCLPRAITFLCHGPFSASVVAEPILDSKPKTRTFPPGLYDLRYFPQLAPYVDPRAIVVREDGAWRFVTEADL